MILNTPMHVLTCQWVSWDHTLPPLPRLSLQNRTSIMWTTLQTWDIPDQRDLQISNTMTLQSFSWHWSAFCLLRYLFIIAQNGKKIRNLFKNPNKNYVQEHFLRSFSRNIPSIFWMHKKCKAQVLHYKPYGDLSKYEQYWQ